MEEDPYKAAPLDPYGRVRPPTRSIGCGWAWLLVLPVGIGIVAGIGGLVVGVCAIFAPDRGPIADFFNDLSGIETRKVPGDADNFDPFGALPGVSDFAGDNAQLIRIDISFVRADGTMNLNADYDPSPRVTYAFVREVDRPDDAPPPGAGGGNAGPWYQPVQIEVYDPGQRRHLSSRGGGTNREVDYVNRGMERTTNPVRSGPQDIIPSPKCSIADMFRVAVERGVPRDAVARVTYDIEGYRFSIDGLAARLEFDMSCAEAAR